MKDSNLHGLLHSGLSRERLPVPANLRIKWKAVRESHSGLQIRSLSSFVLDQPPLDPSERFELSKPALEVRYPSVRESRS